MYMYIYTCVYICISVYTGIHIGLGIGTGIGVDMDRGTGIYIYEAKDNLGWRPDFAPVCCFRSLAHVLR